MDFTQALAIISTASFIFGAMALITKKLREPKKAVVLVKKSK